MRTTIGCLIVAMSVSSPAVAGCYEQQGCTNSAHFSETFLVKNASCDILWQIRNQIYHENGYCFRTPRGMRAFGNSGCRYSNVSAVPLNGYERANVARVARVESIKACPR